MSRAALVYNPVKVGDPDDLVTAVLTRSEEAGWAEPLVLETTQEDSGRGQAEQAVREGVDLVLAAGGDGTIMNVISAVAGTSTALAVLPQGTGNLLARNLDLVPADLDAALDVAFGGVDRVIDVGRVGDRCFAVNAGMGFDADMVADAPDRVKSRLGWFAYVLSGLWHMRRPGFHVVVQVDDGAEIRRRARTVLIANVGRIQGGLQLFPGSEPDDGLLDVAVVSPRRPAEWLPVMARVLGPRRRSTDPRLELRRGRRISIAAASVQRRQLDGDLLEPGRRLDVVVEPGALRVRVPAGSPTAAPAPADPE